MMPHVSIELANGGQLLTEKTRGTELSSVCGEVCKLMTCIKSGDMWNLSGDLFVHGAHTFQCSNREAFGNTRGAVSLYK
jgi:hypothetical protein